MKPESLEHLFLTVVSGDPDELLTDIRAVRSAPLLQYARSWLTLVAREFQNDISEAMASPPSDHPKSSRAAQLAYIGPVPETVSRCIMTIKGVAASDVDETAGCWSEAPMIGKLLLAAAQNILFLVSGEMGRGGTTYRCLGIEASSLFGDGRCTGPRLVLPSEGAPMFKCVEVLTLLNTTQRISAVCLLNRLHPSLRAAIVPGHSSSSSPYEPAWCAVKEPDAAPIRALNEGQRAALLGLAGPVDVVQVRYHPARAAGDRAAQKWGSAVYALQRERYRGSGRRSER